jgi:hypothetical protein
MDALSSHDGGWYDGPSGSAPRNKEVRPVAVRLKSRRKTVEEIAPTDEPAILPNVCPECEGPGYLDYINLARETKVQSCRDCGFRWESAIG